MQTTEDGEYIPSKELQTGFRIPKRKAEENGARGPPTKVPGHAEVLGSSYFEYQVNAPAQFALPRRPPAPQQSPSYGQPPGTVPLPGIDWQSLLSEQKEKPKTYTKHILKETIPDCYDETLPHELRSQFQPLYCKLCTAQLSSNIVAKMHYKSKNHEKKIRKFLIEHAEKTGQPAHPRARPPSKALDNVVSVGPDAGDASNPMYFYCELCDLPLTGKLHAESHYLGKNHRKATLGLKTPAGRGHYDGSGKWIRESSSHKSRGNINLVGENDGFGSTFRKSASAVQSDAAAISSPRPTTPIIGPQIPENVCFGSPIAASSNAARPGVNKFRCDICDVTTTCQDQLETHYNGQKHRKKMKAQGIVVSRPATAATVVPLPVAETCVGPVDVAPFMPDCSQYRTPSGQFYCQVCNSTSNSEAQFRQHLVSKMHSKKAAQASSQSR